MGIGFELDYVGERKDLNGVRREDGEDEKRSRSGTGTRSSRYEDVLLV